MSLFRAIAFPLRTSAKLSHLNLSQFHFSNRIEIPFGEGIDNSELVQGLQEAAHRGIKTVNISGHNEISDLAFSRFRKHLPELQEITFLNVLPSECRISILQFVKYFALGIKIDVEKELHEQIRLDAIQFLLEHDQSGEVFINENLHLYRESFQKAIKNMKEREEQDFKTSQAKSQAKLGNAKHEWEQLQEDWRMKNPNVFDVTSPWVVNGPATATDGFKNSGMEEALFALYLLITKYKLWDEVKKGPNPERGFMFSRLPKLDEVLTYHPINDLMGHSGASYGWAMRVMERIANDGGIKMVWHHEVI